MSNWLSNPKAFLSKLPFLIGFLVIAIAVSWAVFMPMIRFGPPEQIQVEVVEMRTKQSHTRATPDIPNCFVTFEFPDGLRQQYNINYQDYKNMEEHDTGTLTYRPYKKINEAEPYKGDFLSFEKGS
ncbi:MAG: DUF2500 domain-containing protein [Clostridiales bacterium]|nr:DUF2500 domain-containing protein [Clostridiales bacterium]